MTVSKQHRHAPAAQSYGHPCPWDLAIEPVPLPVLFARQAERQGAATLVEFYGRRFGYRELYDEAGRFAAGLRARGIAPGDRIGLFLPNVPAYLSAYYGAMMAGAVVVNFSPLYTAQELAHQVEDSGTRLLVTLNSPALLPTALDVLGRSSLEMLAVARLGAMLPPLKRFALMILGRKQIAAIPRRSGVSTWEDWLAPTPIEPPELSPTKLALLQYTGGTTGTPKGAMLTHANLSANAQQVDAIDPFDRDKPDIILGALPLFHVFANTCVLNRTIVRGGSIVMLPRFQPGQVLGAISRSRPASFPGVPTMYQALLDHPASAKADWSSLNVCVSGGAPMPGPLHDDFERETGVPLVEGYGLTESAGVISVNPYQGNRKRGTIGQLLPGTRALLLDKEDPTRLAAPQEPGELAVSGPQIMAGYWNRPEATNDVFVEHEGERWLRTGDIATIDDEQFLAIVDRSKDMIAVGGFKVFPSRIEAVLVEHEAVKEALVIGIPDAYHGEMPQAFVTLQSQFAEVEDGALRDWLNARVGKHERVAGVTVRGNLPKTMIGKLDRKALRAEVLAG